jgi:hypothetical protein
MLSGNGQGVPSGFLRGQDGCSNALPLWGFQRLLSYKYGNKFSFCKLKQRQLGRRLGVIVAARALSNSIGSFSW